MGNFIVIIVLGGMVIAAGYAQYKRKKNGNVCAGCSQQGMCMGNCEQQKKK